MTDVLALLREVDSDGFEQVVFGHDAASGMRAIVAVHSTVLGPALGGTRFWPYASEAEAVTDVCRLARGMTYKHAAAGLDQGGGKAVIWGDPRTDRTDDLITAYARFVDQLGGRYLTAEDVGTTQADMDLIQQTTPYVTGVSPSLGGSGDPSPATAWGVLWAIRAAAEKRWGSPDLAGRHVVVTGVGKVGSALVGHLVDDGATVTVADVRDQAVRSVIEAHGSDRVSGVDVADAHATECDVFAPCALGAVLSETTVPELRCEIVAGSANNQLATDDDDNRIAQRGILYVPDYVVNAGGVINIAEEAGTGASGGYDHDRAWKRIEGIADTVTNILSLAEDASITPAEAADRYAEDRLERAAAR
ncbi:Glu/Leu/Phe/Val dehydrogenase dimerization domain-containing protein [Actinospongicola halichondriae]|uniref:Glu/Leu/Phe/Val dehydrogenase dimerization domain-containing protein n=1 Tax=Actinospongicola halichondriae TaxID=3236844 RepID=UPI003D494D8A